jgi:DNA-binding NtrC family response regulator
MQEREIFDRKETVLVVDDEDVVRNLSERVLNQYGYYVVTAVDGQQGLDLYTEQKKDIDLVLLDMSMPNMSGKKVLEKMIQIDPEVRVIISSGYSRQDICEETLSQSKEFIHKPYDIKDLVKMVRKVLDINPG